MFELFQPGIGGVIETVLKTIATEIAPDKVRLPEIAVTTRALLWTPTENEGALFLN